MFGKDLVFREWQAASRKAHLLEQAVSRSCLSALEGDGDWPTSELRTAARSSRGLADDLFRTAMAQIEDHARANKAK